MFDATFWVGVSFVIFFVGLIYLKVPQNVNSLLTKMIVDIKNEIDESEKLRSELEKNLEEEIEIAEKEIQNLNKSSAENINKIATETSSGLIKQLIGEEINKENISSIVNALTNNSKENRKNV